MSLLLSVIHHCVVCSALWNDIYVRLREKQIQGCDVTKCLIQQVWLIQICFISLFIHKRMKFRAINPRWATTHSDTRRPHTGAQWTLCQTDALADQYKTYSHNPPVCCWTKAPFWWKSNVNVPTGATGQPVTAQQYSAQGLLPHLCHHSYGNPISWPHQISVKGNADISTEERASPEAKKAWGAGGWRRVGRTLCEEASAHKWNVTDNF